MGVPVIERRSGFVLFHAEGEVDALTAPALRQGLAEAASFDLHVVIDLAGVTFVDSSGLGVLVGAIHRVRATGHAVILCAPNSSVGRALAVAGLRRIVDVVDSVEEARGRLAAVDGHPCVPSSTSRRGSRTLRSFRGR